MNTKASHVADETLTSEVKEEFENAKKAVMDAYANFLEAKKHLKRAALTAGVEFKDSANERLEEAVVKARDKKDELAETTSTYVKENPMTSTSIAFLGGVLFSRIFGR